MTVEHWKLDSRENKLERGAREAEAEKEREMQKEKERNKIIIILCDEEENFLD
jgi:hypothetical protein